MKTALLEIFSAIVVGFYFGALLMLALHLTTRL